MPILSWDKPAKAMSAEAYQRISAEGAPPGVYESNMSEADAYRWRAKRIGGKHPRVEIRKHISYDGPEFVGQTKIPASQRGSTNGRKWYGGREWYGDFAQLKIVVSATRVRISTNGPINMSDQEFTDLNQAVLEAREKL